MYWSEDESNQTPDLNDDVVDVVFSIRCRCLPVDHAYALSQAIQEHLPWFGEEQAAALHTIHVAESANGWIRPNEEGAVLYPSRRTKMRLRVPAHRVDDTKALEGKRLTIGEFEIEVNAADVRLLSTHTTIFSRYIVTDGYADEDAVMKVLVEQLKEMGVNPKKMLCGVEQEITTPDGVIKTRSLMIANLKVEESVRLQQRGLGDHRWLGCGVFIPHKEINQISEDLG